MLKPRKHKVSKNEDIKAIAKKYGFKDWKEIWKHPGNKPLVSKYKDPSGLQPGDILTVPALNEKERVEHREKVRELGVAITVENGVATAFHKRAAVANQIAEICDNQAAKAIAGIEEMKRELLASSKTAKKWSDGVDMAAAVVGILKGLNDIAQKSAKYSATYAEKGADEAMKIYKSLRSDALGFAYSPATNTAYQAVGKELSKDGEISTTKLLIGETINSWGKMTSPSFWGKTFIALRDGKNWSDAATYDYQSEVKLQIAKLEKEAKRLSKGFGDRAKEARDKAKRCEQEAKAAEKRMDAHKKELRELDG